MSINIKEIFKSDLDPNSINWWAKDKIDKLNFNFSQLVNGGVPGPIGLEGTDGVTGNRGVQGLNGDQGSTGIEGTAGLPGLATWVINSSDGVNNITLLPNRMPSPEFAPVGIMIGKNYASTTTEPSNPSSLGNYNNRLPYDDAGSTVAVFYGNDDRSNFGLDSDSDLVFGDHNFNNDVLNIGRALEATEVGSRWLHTVTSLKDTIHSLHIGNQENQNTPILSAIEFSTSLFKVDKPTVFDLPDSVNPLEVDMHTLKYGLNPAANQVIVATDDVGSVIWKSKYEVFGALPIGSIISVSELEFNNTNFHLIDTLQVDADSGLLLNVYGRGRLNTQFEGWYLCNGQTWEKDGIISFEVSNLNKFTFTIESNGADQESVPSGTSPLIVIGGAAVNFDATYNTGNNSYNTSGSLLEDAGTSVTLATGSGKVNSMVHLVNLGEPSLDWKTAEGAAVTVYDIVLSEPRDNYEAACSAPSQTYQWTGDQITDWGASYLPTGTLYLNGSTAPINKWYADDEFARELYGTSWGATNQIEDCPVSTNLDYQASCLNLNWNSTPQDGQPYLLNTTSLSDATTIKDTNGNNGTAGWYRETSQTGTVWYRVFWNGTSVTYRTAENYIHYGGLLETTTIVGGLACKTLVNFIYNEIYYANNTVQSYNTSSLPLVAWLYNNSEQLLVNQGWATTSSGNPLGRFGLIPIADQTIPNSNSTTYKSVVETATGSTTNNSFAGIVQTSSILSSPGSCLPDPVPTYSNTVQSGTAFRNNCSSGYIGSLVNYTVSAGTHTSTISQAAADQLAINNVANNKQTYANTHGSCSYYINEFEPSCFVSGSKVKVYTENGFVDINIEDVQIGDKVLGRDNVLNTVLEYDRPLLSNRKLYDINKNNDYFVSEEHPMLTKKGWKSLKPEYIQKNEIEIWEELFEGREDILLSIGDEMVMYDGTFTVINSLDLKVADPLTQLYNFNLDGDNTYIVNNYVVHNT